MSSLHSEHLTDEPMQPEELASENQKLRAELAQLLHQAQQNQLILQRHQAFDLQCIAAASFHDLLDTILCRFAETTALDIVTLSILDPDYEIRRILADLDIDPAEWPQLLFLQDESGFAVLSGHLTKPALGIYSETLHGMLFPASAEAPASVAIMPLRRRGRLIGSLNLGSSDGMRFTHDMGTDFIEHMASIVAVCLENVVNIERLKYMGLTDPLTGVNNRRYIERRLQEEIGRSMRHGYTLSCLYIDIDHFKQINDRLGHQAGDEVLRCVAERIKEELRLSDALGRFGGEEFVALLIDAEQEDALHVAERIRLSIAEQPLSLSSGESLDVTISVGIAALLRPDISTPIETLVREFVARADQALYQAKAGGRNRVMVAA